MEDFCYNDANRLRQTFRTVEQGDDLPDFVRKPRVCDKFLSKHFSTRVRIVAKRGYTMSMPNTYYHS